MLGSVEKWRKDVWSSLKHGAVEAQVALRAVWALMWLPGTRGTGFADLFRPIGSGVALALSSEEGSEGRDRLVLTGVTARLDWRDGVVAWGRRGTWQRYGYNFSREPVCTRNRTRSWGDRMQVPRHEMLVRMGTFMHSRRVHTNSIGTLQSVPVMPRVYLGFADIPRAQPNPAWEAAAAERGVSVDEYWASMFIDKQAHGNNTGNYLLPHSIAPEWGRYALQVWEGFHELVGDHRYNPAREMAERNQLPTRKNPALDVMAESGVRPGTRNEWANDPAVLGRVLAGMRALLPDMPDDDLVDGLEHPRRPLLDSRAALRLLRSHLDRATPWVNDWCLDDDLIQAARSTQQPLYASKAPRVQRLYRNPAATLDAALVFDEQRLGIQHYHADFIGAADRWRHPRVKAVEAAAEEEAGVEEVEDANGELTAVG